MRCMDASPWIPTLRRLHADLRNCGHTQRQVTAMQASYDVCPMQRLPRQPRSHSSAVGRRPVTACCEAAAAALPPLAAATRRLAVAQTSIAQRGRGHSWLIDIKKAAIRTLEQRPTAAWLDEMSEKLAWDIR